jgi:transketolase
MRVEFAQAIVELALARQDLVFLSGDLGYMALEKVRESLGARFINAGVAEQNMVSTAAGLAARGFVPIVYSIAPFATLRPLEQIRNDVCLHNLPVTIVGNGGGYGYGIMGSTHHALEDVGIMRTLPNMRVFTPAFGGDVAHCLKTALARKHPSYIRLGKSVQDFGTITSTTPWSGFRRVSQGSRLVLAVMGPVIENVISVLNKLPAETVDLWSIGEFPITQIPEEFKNSVIRTGRLITVEEHYRSGGLSENIAPFLVGLSGVQLEAFTAAGYPSGLYGSQKWHQEESALGEAGLQRAILETLAA